MNSHSSLAATLLANFRTILLPPCQCASAPPMYAVDDWWAAAKAARTERRSVDSYLQRLRRELIEHGYRAFLDHVECDSEGGWRVHVFLAGETGVVLLNEITNGTDGPGDPIAFDPEEFVRERLQGTV